jgi:hypothetical protein
MMTKRQESVNEIQREIQVREHVYPKLVMVGKLTVGEAERRVAALKHALFLLAGETPGDDNQFTNAGNQ